MMNRRVLSILYPIALWGLFFLLLGLKKGAAQTPSPKPLSSQEEISHDAWKNWMEQRKNSYWSFWHSINIGTHIRNLTVISILTLLMVGEGNSLLSIGKCLPSQPCMLGWEKSSFLYIILLGSFITYLIHRLWVSLLYSAASWKSKPPHAAKCADAFLPMLLMTSISATCMLSLFFQMTHNAARKKRMNLSSYEKVSIRSKQNIKQVTFYLPKKRSKKPSMEKVKDWIKENNPDNLFSTPGGPDQIEEKDRGSCSCVICWEATSRLIVIHPSSLCIVCPSCLFFLCSAQNKGIKRCPCRDDSPETISGLQGALAHFSPFETAHGNYLKFEKNKKNWAMQPFGRFIYAYQGYGKIAGGLCVLSASLPYLVYYPYLLMNHWGMCLALLLV